jgi:hypothetical protein
MFAQVKFFLTVKPSTQQDFNRRATHHPFMLRFLLHRLDLRLVLGEDTRFHSMYGKPKQ